MFVDRSEAGRKLATALERFRARSPLVLALPRGGVPVAYEVARALGAPLDVIVARKLGAPGHEEYGIGAVAQGGASYVDVDLVRALGISAAYLELVARRELTEVARRVRAYRGDRPPVEVAGRTVILVDDGLATGATTRAAARSLRGGRPRELVLAVPVCASDRARAVGAEVDEVVCLSARDDLRAVGLWYDDFTQTSDEEVVALLARAERERRAPRAADGDWCAPRGAST